MIKKDLVIIGGGSAGMAAAISAYDHGIKDILILEKGESLGGILHQCIHNGFGLKEFKEELTGPEFLTRFVNQIKERNIEYKLNSFVMDVSKEKVITFANKIDGFVEVEAKAIVFTAGCYERNAGAIGIPGDRPSGILTAGQAQLYLNKHGYLVGKKVFILGSGDIGLIMARRMSLEGAEVVGVAEIMPYSNGLNRNIVQCLNDFNIPLYLSHTVSRVFGKKKLEKIELSKVDENLKIIPGSEKTFEVDTLLLSVGLVPYTQLLTNIGIPTSPSKGVMVNDHLETPVDGIFAAGNVLHVHDLVDNVVDEARLAGYSAAKYLKGELARHETITCKAGNGIGYVVPNELDLSNLEEVTPFKFRVRKPIKNVNVVISSGKEIKRIFKPVLIPSEMEVLNISKDLLVGLSEPLTISLIEKEDK